MLTQTVADDGAPHDPAPAVASARGTRPTPFLLLVGAVALLVPVQVAGGPIRDIDLYWHLLVGQDILAGSPGRRGRSRVVVLRRS